MKTAKMVLLAMTAIASVLVLAQPARAELTADAIVQKADEGRLPVGSLSFTSTVKDYVGEKLIRESRYHVLNKSDDASLVETLYPERQQGRKLLMEGDNLWFSTPNTKRAARVSMHQRLTGEIANGDLVRTHLASDYSATLVGTERLDGKDVYHLDLKAKHSGVTYSRLEYWVSKKELLPVKAAFYAISGKLLKTGVFSDAKLVLGHLCVTKLRVQDALDPQRRSVMTHSNHQRAEIMGSVFNKESLAD